MKPETTLLLRRAAAYTFAICSLCILIIILVLRFSLPDLTNVRFLYEFWRWYVALGVAGFLWWLAWE